MNYYYFAKSIHVLGFVSWFAGLFYLVRLFIYHAEATERKSEAEAQILLPQYELMATRLYNIITNPAMIITWIAGISMIALGYLNDEVPNWMKINDFARDGWLHIKLGFVILLTGYQHYCKAILKRLKNGTNRFNSQQLRGINEIPTIILLAIALLAVYKNLSNFGWAFLGVFAFGVMLFVGIRVYKRNRERAEQNANN